MASIGNLSTTCVDEQCDCHDPHPAESAHLKPFHLARNLAQQRLLDAHLRMVQAAESYADDPGGAAYAASTHYAYRLALASYRSRYHWHESYVAIVGVEHERVILAGEPESMRVVGREWDL